jgi:predicted O-methyltransferase YrrM
MTANKKAQNILEQLTAVHERFGRPLFIVETGTIRNAAQQYEVGDGHSTSAIAGWILDNSLSSEFFSIDIETKVAAEYLERHGLRDYVVFMREHSLTALNRLCKNGMMFDFIYLDSANDAQNTLDEFKLAWPMLNKGGCMMCDDCNESSAELHKGDMLMPYLRQIGIAYTEKDNQLIILK